MATATAFGSITIIDVTDIGEFSIYPMSNLPLSVIYTPDTPDYNPNWGSTNLILTPVVYYAGSEVTLGTSGLTITWTKMNDTSSADLGSNEVVSSTGVLTVSANQFSSTVSLVTYMVTASYVEPTSGQTLTAKGQITFSLVRMASEVRNISISGSNVFKYDTNSNCTPSSLTLTATPTNTNIVGWEYSNDNGINWNSTSTSTSTYTIESTSAIFASKDSVLIKVIASDKNDATKFYYDYINILKLRDGAAGVSTIAMVLDNEDQMIPCNSSGTPSSVAFDLAYTSCIVYSGGTDVTSSYTIKATPVNCLGAWTTSTTTKPTGTSTADQEKGSNTRFWVTGWNGSSEVAYVTFTATKSGANTITKTMSLSKIKTGADGVSPEYKSLSLSSLTTNKSYTYNSEDKVSGTTYSPSSITASAVTIKGSTSTAYNGYIKVFLDGSTTASASGSMNNGSYTLEGIGGDDNCKPSTSIKFELYSGSGSDAVLYDTQTVAVTSDGIKGQTGQTGQTGQGAVSLVLGNYSDNIGVNTSYKVPATTTLTIPFCAYQGTSKIACTIAADDAKITMGSQTITPTVTAATTSTDGSLVYSVTTASAIGSSTVLSGSKSLTFTYTLSSGTTGTVTATYSWGLSVTGATGSSARAYYITPSVGQIIRKETASNTYSYSPSTIYANFYYNTTSTGIAQKGVWNIESTTDGSTWTSLTTLTSSSSVWPASGEYSIASLGSTVQAIRITVYSTYSSSSSSFSGLYSQTTIPIIDEATDGASTTSTSSVDYQTSTSGTTTPTGTWQSTVPSVTNGQFLWTRTTIVYTTVNKYGTSSTDTKYAYSVSYKGTNGTNSVILQVSTPNGYIFSNGTGTLTINASLINGSSTQTSSVTYQWYKFNSSSTATDKYDTIADTSGKYSGTTSATLTVYGAAVDSYASFKCVATYSSKSYVGYASLIDKTDPLQVTIISTIGTQIVNSQGVGAFYAKVVRNGTEIDSLPSGVKFVTSQPSSLTTGAYYYLLNSTNKTVTLKKASSTSAWADATDISYSGTYTWTYRDATGASISKESKYTSGKVIYIDASLINKKVTIDVEVDI